MQEIRHIKQQPLTGEEQESPGRADWTQLDFPPHPQLLQEFPPTSYFPWSLLGHSHSGHYESLVLFLISFQEMHDFLPHLLESTSSHCKSKLSTKEMCFSFCQCQTLRSNFCINFPPFSSCCFLSSVQKALKACQFSVPFCGTTTFSANLTNISAEDANIIHCCWLNVSFSLGRHQELRPTKPPTSM